MSSTSSRRRSRSGLSYSHAVAFLAGGCAATLVLELLQSHVLHSTHNHLEHFAQEHLQPQVRHQVVSPLASLPDRPKHTHDVAGLDCAPHGGPTSEAATKEMVYWKDLPLDNDFVSPLKSPTERQYLTFEPDGGGWNNIRMSMETVLTMAVATGRVLVLPPSQRMYLLGTATFSFADFFPLQEIAHEHAGLEILTMEQFLQETMGTTKDLKTMKMTEPPDKRTNWNGDTQNVKNKLNPWLQSIATNPDWNPDDCLAAFPKTRDPKDAQVLQDTFDALQKGAPINVEDYVNQPTPVNAALKERMAEFIAGRKEMCLYTPELQQARILHFHGKRNLGGRLLVHFYAFLFFHDYHHDLWMKRFVRDHVRYLDDIECAAARIVEAVRARARTKDPKNIGGLFDAFHVRRGDFQYKKTRIEANEIVDNAKDQIPVGTTVYVGTDERKKEFFDPLKDHGWDVVFLDDYMHLIKDLDKNHYGMIDQLVTSRSRTFFGCWFSTFTGYITRLRGYHSQNDESEGYDMGLLPTTYYYALVDHKTKLHDYWPIKKLFYAREYPPSWRNLDFDLD